MSDNPKISWRATMHRRFARYEPYIGLFITVGGFTLIAKALTVMGEIGWAESFFIGLLAACVLAISAAALMVGYRRLRPLTNDAASLSAPPPQTPSQVPTQNMLEGRLLRNAREMMKSVRALEFLIDSPNVDRKLLDKISDLINDLLSGPALDESAWSEWELRYQHWKEDVDRRVKPIAEHWPNARTDIFNIADHKFTTVRQVPVGHLPNDEALHRFKCAMIIRDQYRETLEKADEFAREKAFRDPPVLK